jgi:hypothetical protein
VIDEASDDELVGGSGDKPIIKFSEAGYYRMKLLWCEFGGYASLHTRWKRSAESTYRVIEPRLLYAVHPGMPVGVRVAIGSVLAEAKCSAGSVSTEASVGSADGSRLQARLPSPLCCMCCIALSCYAVLLSLLSMQFNHGPCDSTAPFLQLALSLQEPAPAQLTWKANNCAFFYSSHFTPTLTGGTTNLQALNMSHPISISASGLGNDSTSISVSVHNERLGRFPATVTAVAASGLTFTPGPQAYGSAQKLRVHVAGLGDSLVTESGAPIIPVIKVCKRWAPGLQLYQCSCAKPVGCR